MQLVTVPQATFWRCIVWMDYQPHFYRRFGAPCETERATKEASAYRVESRIVRWLDNITRAQLKKIDVMVVRCIDTERVADTRLNQEEAFEVWRRIATWAGCPIIQCNLVALKSEYTERYMKLRHWDEFHRDRHPCIRLGIHYGYHTQVEDLTVPMIPQNQEVIAKGRMNLYFQEFQGLLDKYVNKPLDDAFVDGLYKLGARVMTDTSISDQMWPVNDRIRWVKVILDIASSSSLHVKHKIDKTLDELKRLGRSSE